MRSISKLLFAGLLLGGTLALSHALPAQAEDPIVGTWTGEVDQPGYGSYPMTMTLTSASGGTTEYPSLGCGGTLSGGGSGGVYHYTETITHGGIQPDSEGRPDGCITGGSIRVVMQGDRLFWEWTGSYESQSYTATAKLDRLASSGPARTCGECEEALFSGIAYGLQQSQGLRNYVREARQNYSNCVRDVPDGCARTPGRQLYDNLPTCDAYDNDAGYRACVERLLKGAQLSR